MKDWISTELSGRASVRMNQEKIRPTSLSTVRSFHPSGSRTRAMSERHCLCVITNILVAMKSVIITQYLIFETLLLPFYFLCLVSTFRLGHGFTYTLESDVYKIDFRTKQFPIASSNTTGNPATITHNNMNNI